MDGGDGLVFAGMGTGSLVFCLVAIFIAAIIRGYTGFGFSALVVSSMTLVLPPAESVPVILLLEVAASIGMLPHVWRDIDWRAIMWLCIGAAVGTPIGVYALATVPPDPARIVIAILVLFACVLLLRGYSLKGRPGPFGTTATGAVSGIVNGIGAVGGLPVVIFFLATATGAAMTRATVVGYFFFTDLFATIFTAGHGLVTTDVLLRTALFLVPLYLGVALGSRRFMRTSPESFRRLAIVLLMVLSALGLARAIVAV